MKSIFKVATLVVAASFVSAPAFAYGYSVPQPVVPRNSFYADIDAGIGTLSTPAKYLCDPNTLTCPLYDASYETGSVVAGANIGYHLALNPHFLIGTELGYDYNGSSSYKGWYSVVDWNSPWYFDDYEVTYRVTSQDVHGLLTATALFQSGFSFFAKGGAARVYQTLTVDGQQSWWTEGEFPTSTQTINGFKPMAAMGVGFQRGKFNVYLQYAHIFGTDANDFKDFFDMDTLKMNKIVSVDTLKVGVGVTIPVI